MFVQEVSGVLQRGIFVFLMKESKKRRQKQPGKLMAKSHSQLVNLPGARPLMNPLVHLCCDILILIVTCKYMTLVISSLFFEM